MLPAFCSFILLTAGDLMGQVEKGLVSRYEFNGNVNDSKGTNPANGTSMQYGSDRFGRTKSAAEFTGYDDNQIAKVSAEIIDLKADFTISLWYYMTDISKSDYKVMLSSRILNNGNWAGGLDLGIEMDSTFIAAFRKPVSAGEESVIDVRPDVKINNNETNGWHLIVIVKKGSAVMFYHDGQLKFYNSISNYGTNNCVNGDNWTFGSGKKSTGIYREFNGLLDDIRFYSRAISATEVDSLYNFVPSAGFYELRPSFRVSIYPNPAAEIFTIECVVAADYQISDMTGKVCQSGFVAAGESTTVNWNALPAGAYVIQLNSGTGLVRRKLIKL